MAVRRNCRSTNALMSGQAVFTLASPFAAPGLPGLPGTLSLRAASPDLRNAYVQQYTVSLKR
jgi:hypothetical protein